MMESPVSKQLDLDIQMVIDQIIQNGMGNPIVFQAEPTLATMMANTWGIYGGSMYIKFTDDTGLVLSGLALT